MIRIFLFVAFASLIGIQGDNLNPFFSTMWEELIAPAEWQKLTWYGVINSCANQVTLNGR